MKKYSQKGSNNINKRLVRRQRPKSKQDVLREKLIAHINGISEREGQEHHFAYACISPVSFQTYSLLHSVSGQWAIYYNEPLPHGL